MIFSSEINTYAKEDESFLIKRAYLDTIGLIPTPQEIEWYTVYNRNGYKLAVEWLMRNPRYDWNIPRPYAKILLLSKEYRELPKVEIPKEQVLVNLLFVTGKSLTLTDENVKDARLTLINNAILCSDGETEIIDYMCNSLMCRGSNLIEINKLTKIFKESNKPELEAWMDVLDEILELEDVNTK